MVFYFNIHMQKRIRTRSIHSGEKKDRANRGIPPPVALTSTFFFKNVDELERHKGKSDPRVEYGRYQNPTRAVAEQKLAELEGAEDAIVCASGMYAIAITLLRILKPGDHILILDEMYHRTEELCSSLIAKFGVEISIPYIAPSLGGTESLVIPYSVVVPPTIREVETGKFR